MGLIVAITLALPLPASATLDAWGLSPFHDPRWCLELGYQMSWRRRRGAVHASAAVAWLMLRLLLATHSFLIVRSQSQHCSKASHFLETACM